MKYVLLLCSLTMFSQLSMAASNILKLNANWNDENIQIYTMDDNDLLQVSLPFIKGSHVTAEVIDNSQMLSECKVVSIKNTPTKTVITFKLGETSKEDGFNGCVADISRNLPNDEDGTGKIIVEFGYLIND